MQLLTVIVVKVLLRLTDIDLNKILVVNCERVTLQTVDIVSCC